MSWEDPTSHLFWYPGHELFIKDIVRAENCYLYDSKGKRYLDLESGVWCTSVGHSNPKILHVLSEQAAQIAHTGYSYSNRVVEEAAQEILALLGFQDGKCVFLCSGSEAVEYGVRVAQSIAERPLLMTMTDSYFGAYGSASRRQKDEWFCFDWTMCAACPSSNECSKQCEHWAEIPFGDIGGFLFEPGSSSGLVRFPPQKLIRSIVNAIKAEKGLVLVNEVTTGVGRTGRWFGYEHYGISPDIVAVGKGIGNGYPVSVAAFARSALDRLESPIHYSQSHQNDPLGAAVARQVIHVIQEEGLIERGRETADVLTARLKGIAARHPAIKEVRARGLMIALEFHDDPETSFTIRTHRELVRRGYIVARRPGLNVFRIDPSLTVERKDIEAFAETLEEIVADKG